MSYLLIKITLIRARALVVTRLNKDAHEAIEKLEVLPAGRQAEGVNRDRRGLPAYSHIAPCEQAGKAFIAAAQIKNYSVRTILLEIGQEKVQQKTLAGTGCTQNHGMRVVLV